MTTHGTKIMSYKINVFIKIRYEHMDLTILKYIEHYLVRYG